MSERSDRDERRLTIAQWRWMRWRYFHLMGTSAIMMRRPRQRVFQWRLRRAGRRVPVRDLMLMLEAGGWREQLTANWLIAAGRREEMRPAIERGLLGDHPYRSRGYFCIPLACLGTETDAQILVTYLDWALTLPPEPEGFGNHCQAGALANLVYLDRQLGTPYAQRFLGDDGPWRRWLGSEDDTLEELQDGIRISVLLASGRDPGVRRMLKLGGQW